MKYFFYALLLGWMLCGCEEQQTDPKPVTPRYEPPVLATIQSKLQDIPQFYSVTGELQSFKKVTLSAEIQAKIVQRPVKVGDIVAEKALLFQLDDENLKIQQESIVDNIKMEEARMYQCKINLDRQQRLADATTQEKLEAAELDYQIAQKRKSMLEKSLEEISLQLKKVRVTAPFTCEVSQLYHEQDEFVSIGKPLISVIDRSQMKLIVYVPASVLQFVQENISLEVEVLDVEKILQAKVFRVYPEANSNTKKFPVEIRIDNTGRILRAGMFCRVNFSLPKKSFILVDPSYVRTSYSMLFAKVKNQQTELFEERKIQAEWWQGKWIIHQGIQEQEWLQEY